VFRVSHTRDEVRRGLRAKFMLKSAVPVIQMPRRFDWLVEQAEVALKTSSEQVRATSM